jgi:E3 ubiquitin-protein ligase DOA10
MENEALLEGQLDIHEQPKEHPSTSAQFDLTDDEEHETVCRICRMPAEPDNPLYHPCRCSGSIRYVHSSCLSLWLERSKHDSCEVCDLR